MDVSPIDIKVNVYSAILAEKYTSNDLYVMISSVIQIERYQFIKTSLASRIQNFESRQLKFPKFPGIKFRYKNTNSGLERWFNY